MEAAVVRQFVDLFRDFVNLNEIEDWPDESTSEQEIVNAYILAVHVEKYVDRFQKRGILDEFLDTTLNEEQKRSRPFLRDCFTNPSKIVLKKIIHSQTSIKQMEVGVKLYLEIYSADMLTSNLAHLFVETASRETLIRNLSTEFTKRQLVEFKSKLLLSELKYCNKPEEVLNELLNNTNQDCIELLAVSLLNNDPNHDNSVCSIKVAFKQTMLSKKQTDKYFWKYFFRIKEKYLQSVCSRHQSLFKLICMTLFDVGKLLKEQMSTEFFYIDLTYTELIYIVQTICDNTRLMYRFIEFAREFSDDAKFWEQMILNVTF